MSASDQTRSTRLRPRTLVIAAIVMVALVAVLIVTQLSHGPSQANALSPLPSSAAEKAQATNTQGASVTAPASAATTAPPAGAKTTTAPAKTTTKAPVPGAAATPAVPAAGASAAAASVPAPAAVAAAAVKNASAFVHKTATALTAVAQPSSAELSALATGSAYDALVASTDEFKNNGWHQVGSPTVVSTKVTHYDPSAKPAALTLNVCIDASKVNVLTAAGDIVRKGSVKDRSINIMTVVRSATGAWVVSRVTFPNNPAC